MSSTLLPEHLRILTRKRAMGMIASINCTRGEDSVALRQLMCDLATAFEWF
jgi:hypothetical protein